MDRDPNTMAEYKNVALVDFHRPKEDEIVSVIGKELRQYLNKKLKENEELEIEAKIGLIMPSNDISTSDPFYSIFYSSHGLIMPEQKWYGKTLYYFNPGVPKDKFDLLIQIFSKEGERRLDNIPQNLDPIQEEGYRREYGIKDLGEHMTIDRTFEDGVRSTYTSDNEFKESLKKHKLKHINYFNKGRDFRISIAIEEKGEGPTIAKIKNTRHKRRRSFQFKWLKFEFTETVDENFKGEKAEPIYEIELEICDPKFFNDPRSPIYYKFVDRFLSNIRSLIVAVNEGEDVFFDAFGEPEYHKAYKEAYECDVMPVVGDYLATKAWSDKF